MKFGIATLSIIPVRKAPEERSEMVTQILFGEHFAVLAEKNNWALIQHYFDNYEGWIDRKMYEDITGDYHNLLVMNPSYVVKELINISHVEIKQQPLIILAGSNLPLLQKDGKFTINKTAYFFKGEQGVIPLSRDFIATTAQKYINSPYLWGGRSPFGIDCSGFSQIVYKINGISLPRDASQQVEIGETVSLSNALKGDLAFFENPSGRVSHVGILLENNTIIHASGKVRIDKIDEKGIFNAELNTYTHSLNCLKKIIV